MPLFTGSKFGFGKDAAGGGGPVGPGQPFSASGGDVTPAGITPGNGYTYHVFTSPGNLVCTQAGSIEVFGVGGGGGSYTCSPSDHRSSARVIWAI